MGIRHAGSKRQIQSAELYFYYSAEIFLKKLNPECLIWADIIDKKLPISYGEFDDMYECRNKSWKG